MSPIRAVFEGGLFRPLEPVDLPEGTRVEVVTSSQTRGMSAMDEVHSSDRPDLADESWASGVGREWAEDWDDPREDMDTLEDGGSVDGPR